MVKQVLMSIVTAGIMTFGFTACSDELSMENNEGAPSTEDIRSMRLEQYSYSVPVRVNAEGDWKVDLRFDNEDRHPLYVLSLPEGPAPRRAAPRDTIRLMGEIPPPCSYAV